MRVAPPKPLSRRSSAGAEADPPETYGYPFGPYALAAPPEQAASLVVRAERIWTCGPQGVLENAQIEIAKGKITYVGARRDVAGAKVIQGEHLTPGIVDCHSHTGISKGINDSGQAVTAEVRIGDVTNPDHISWYRQLAGGVTTVHYAARLRQPHRRPEPGQQDPLGRAPPRRLALSGRDARHQVRARRERQAVELGRRLHPPLPPDAHGRRDADPGPLPAPPSTRRALPVPRCAPTKQGHEPPVVDLELEALAEILEGKRLIHCHSYRQDEILMLLPHRARSSASRSAPSSTCWRATRWPTRSQQHAIGGSCVQPTGGPIRSRSRTPFPTTARSCTSVGVTVSVQLRFSNDLARRMNIEAAKAVKYGGVAPRTRRSSS